MVYTTISKFEISTLRSANFLRGWWRSQWRSQWVVWVEMGRMGRVGKREHHLTARQCKAQGSNNADNAQPSDARPRSGLSCLYCHSRPKITRDPRDEKDKRDDSEISDNIYLHGSAKRSIATTLIPDLALVPIVSLVPLVSK